MPRWDNLFDSEHDSFFDPLCIERSSPMDDEEAELVETICQAATPGPLVVDDGKISGEGAIVAILPDGRPVVSLTAPVEQTEGTSAAASNAELICKARYLLLKLLRDREQWKQQQEYLEERICKLEAALRAVATTDESDSLKAHPR